jgi:hypothetical protein
MRDEMPPEHVFLAVEKQSINWDLGLFVLLSEFLPLVLDDMAVGEVCAR